MSSKSSIYRNTAIIAGSSFVNMAVGIVRNKVFALFLGPIGMGQFGVLNDLITLTFNASSLGLGSSGVQAISSANAKHPETIGAVYNTLIRISLLLGALATIFLLVFAPQLSVSIGGDDSYTWFIRIAAFSVLLRLISSIHSALINGMQQIKLLAKSYIYQSVATAVLGIILAIFLGPASIPYLVFSLGLGVWVVTYIQVKKVKCELPVATGFLNMKALWPILIFGVSTIWGGVLNTFVMLTTKSQIAHNFTQAYVGYYQVALGLTAMYIDFITSSMSKDYYPRLVLASEQGKDVANDLVNKQISVSVVIIMPFLLVFLIFSKFFMHALYSSAFIMADELLIYTIAGTFLKVLSWPISFVFLSRRATKVYFITETLANVALLTFNMIAIHTGDFSLVGLAYVAHYLFYFILVMVIYYKKYEGNIISSNIRTILINAFFICVVVVAKVYLSTFYMYLLSVPILFLYIYMSRNEVKALLQSLNIIKR